MERREERHLADHLAQMEGTLDVRGIRSKFLLDFVNYGLCDSGLCGD